MPFLSKSQQRFFFQAEAKGELPKGTARRWAHETKNLKDLPDKKKKESLKAAQELVPGLYDLLLKQAAFDTLGGTLSDAKNVLWGDNSLERLHSWNRVKGYLPGGLRSHITGKYVDPAITAAIKDKVWGGLGLAGSGLLGLYWLYHGLNNRQPMEVKEERNEKKYMPSYKPLRTVNDNLGLDVWGRAPAKTAAALLTEKQASTAHLRRLIESLTSRGITPSWKLISNYAKKTQSTAARQAKYFDRYFYEDGHKLPTGAYELSRWARTGRSLTDLDGRAPYGRRFADAIPKRIKEVKSLPFWQRWFNMKPMRRLREFLLEDLDEVQKKLQSGGTDIGRFEGSIPAATHPIAPDYDIHATVDTLAGKGPKFDKSKSLDFTKVYARQGEFSVPKTQVETPPSHYSPSQSNAHLGRTVTPGRNSTTKDY